MKKLNTFLATAFAIITISVQTSNAQCPVAGIASATKDSICDNDSTTLLLTGSNGTIQWQSFNGSIWINEVGTGSTTASYSVTPLLNTDYRAYVTCVGGSDDSSNVISIVVGFPAPTTTGASRCGYGQVTLTASSTGSIKWYDTQTGGNLLGTGTPFSPTVINTTTFWAEAVSNGGGSGVTPMPAQTSTFPGNARGYFFIAPVNFNLTGVFVPEPVNGTLQNVAVVRFTGAVPPPAYPTTTLAFTTLFLTQNDPTVGVIPVSIPIVAGDVIGVLGTRGPGDINSYHTPSPDVTTINGQSVTITRMGMQFPLATTAPQDLWTEAGGNISRVELTYEIGCESPRTAAVATVTFADSVDINATATALCQGTSATLSASSNNAGYSYTWSPATGLNTTTGATVIATPLTPTTYTVVGTDGTCANIDSVYINVGPASVAGTASINTDTICTGTTATLTLTGSTGSIQWQSNNGTIWVNETGQGFDSSVYVVSPTSFTQYQAIVTSGGCAPDTTIVLSVDVLTISDPTTVNDTICGPGIVNLSASGTGTLNWYAGLTGSAVLNSGSTYSPTIASTTTYYVEASAGAMYHVGPANTTIGNQTTSAALDYGLQFDCNKQCILQRVYISAAQTGTISVNLRAIQGGAILATATANVTAFTGQQPLDLGFSISPGTAYRLELQTGSAQLYRNTGGAAFPYTIANCPITITGYVNPIFFAGTEYFWFYDWVVDDGCHSNRIPVSGVVNQIPPVPTISQTFNTLSSSSPTGNQWYFNGVLMAGETGQVLVITQTGNYTVVVSSGPGCSTTSAVFTVTFIGVKELAGNAYSVYPNPTTGNITIKFANPIKANALLRITDAVGRNVFEQTTTTVLSEIKLNTKLPSGNYFMEIKTNEGVASEKIEIIK